MKTINTIAVALLVTAAFLTSAPPAVAAPLSKEDDAGVRKVVTDFEKSWNTHDMKLMGTLFREDAEFVNIAGMHWRGREAIVKAHVILDESMFKNSKIKTEAIETRAISPDVAVAVVTESIDSFTTPGGQVMPPSQILLNYIMTKGRDGWKIAHDANVQINAEAAKHDPVNPAAK